ncbi:MAG: TetR/AcrR family transcriptional regulator [Psychrosphaera sp.]|nr:TetR/AcrR family transcriptional regulator [Psychrosphaera sp.]
MASKTAQRILLVSLELFNTHGEANITSVDIANELDMSPGNLYYHFKGKEEITAALFSMYHDRMKKILFAPGDNGLVIKDFFYFLYVTFETSHLFRFLYRNPSDLVTKYPYIERGFKQLIKAKEKGFKQILGDFSRQGTLAVQNEQIVHLIELISMVLTQGLNYYVMKGDDIDNEDIIYRGLAAIFFAISPYLSIDEEQADSIRVAIANCTLDDA